MPLLKSNINIIFPLKQFSLNMRKSTIALTEPAPIFLNIRMIHTHTTLRFLYAATIHFYICTGVGIIVLKRLVYVFVTRYDDIWLGFYSFQFKEPQKRRDARKREM